MYNCIICDDNRETVMAVHNYMVELYENKFNFSLRYGINGFNLIESMCWDLLIIDIDLIDSDGVNSSGIDIAAGLKRRNPDMQVIFISAFHEYAQDIFEVNPVYYIQKPIKKSVLKTAVDKAVSTIEHIKDSMFSFNIGLELYNIKMSDILYFESDKRRMKIITDHDQYEFYSKISDVESRIDERFCKCHQSFIVNMEHIIRITGTFAVLDAGINVPVSQSRYRIIRKEFARYIGSAIL